MSFTERYKRITTPAQAKIVTEQYNRLIEAGEAPQPAEDEDQQNLAALGLGGGDQSGAAPAPAADPNAAAATPPVDPNAPPADGTENPEEDAQAEAEKEKEQELQGKVSNILSDISDMMGPETLRYYRDVEAKAVQYLTKLDMDPAEKDELISKIPEIGLKILSASKKNNFIDRDNICFVAVMEGAVDFLEKMKGKSEHPELPLDDEESDEEPEEKIEDDEEE